MNNEEKQQLYRVLEKLRRDIKRSERAEYGRTPTVCNDNALQWLVEMRPTSKEALSSVTGVGDSFIENYGDIFIDAINEFALDDAEKKIVMSHEQEHILRELEKKLTSINKRNRLLYFARLTNKTGVDLMINEDDLDVEKSILKGRTIIIKNEQNTDYEVLYRKCRSVSRESNKELREKGQNNLYIGYPFAKGRLSGENFDIRAPLVLFPIVVDVKPEYITISSDDSRDVQYNSALILANYKFSDIREPIPDIVIDDIQEDTFVNDAISFYSDNHIEIKRTDNGLLSFEEYRKESFPAYTNGEIYLEKCAILGRFPVCDNAIQKDFDSILESGYINTLLDQLLEGVVDISYLDDSYDGEYEWTIDDRELEISEHDLRYINDLNSSQEAVLNAVDTMDSIVVQGPPGTGKSQTIASLIADAVTKEMSVLMVSEKKTALDVVYSRIGDLSKYALLIDDVTNKNLFYSQMENLMYDRGISSFSELGKIETISSKIDNQIHRLEEIADKLFEPDETLGVEPYKLFVENEKINLDDEDESEFASTISECIDASIFSWDYETLRHCVEFFDRENTLAQCAFVLNTQELWPAIKNINSNMSAEKRASLKKDAEEIVESIQIWQNKGFLARLFSKGELVKTKLNPFREKYLESDIGDTFAWFSFNKDSLIKASEKYNTYNECKPIFDSLSEEEHLYLESVCNAKLELEIDVHDANKEVYNYIIFYHIDRFQMENRPLLQTISNYKEVIRDIERLINQKKAVTKEQLLIVLSNYTRNLQYSKRGRDMQRNVQSRRRMSVNRFVNKYKFELFNYVKIWLLTPEVVSEIIPLENGLFDLVIFDEASQMYVEKGLPSILRAKKVVVAGDTKQLRPSSLGSGRIEITEEELPEDEDMPASLEEESLLDLARSKYRDVLLNYHYRSNYEELIAFSNYAFYRAGLYVSPNTSIRENPPIEVIKVNDGIWSNRANFPEAKRVVELLKTIFNTRKKSETIGIITFNISQRDLIDDLIDEECAVNPEFAAQIRTELNRKKDGEDIGLFVKNIESVQGDERDIIIFSIGYARNENGRLIRNFGWLNQKGGENRLNVAVSRAKDKVYIVTSIHPEELQVEDVKNNGPRYLKKYMEYAFAISSRDRNAANNVLRSFGDQANPGEVITFDSVFEEEVYNALVERGYTVDTQVGIGGYSIDLAIKHNGEYILGIECDGKLYHSSKTARERDYHRQKYLESRGWLIHRIWSTNWWNDSDNEIRAVSQIADARIKELPVKERQIKATSNTYTEEESCNSFEMKESQITLMDFFSEETIQQEEKGESEDLSNEDYSPRTLHTLTGDLDITRMVSASSIANYQTDITEESLQEKKCENCKLFRKGECAGLEICDDYQPVPDIR